jgi:large subunit ribosomal protein L24
MDIRRDDRVVVLSGKDKGKEGKVISVDPTDRKVIVEGVNTAKRHKKPRKQGDPGGIIKKDTPIYASKVMRVCPKCNKPTRAAHLIKKGVGKDKEEVKVRVCKKCGAEI